MFVPNSISSNMFKILDNIHRVFKIIQEDIALNYLETKNINDPLNMCDKSLKNKMNISFMKSDDSVSDFMYFPSEFFLFD